MRMRPRCPRICSSFATARIFRSDQTSREGRGRSRLAPRRRSHDAHDGCQMTGRLPVMIALLDAGATIDLAAPDGMTALLAACAFARTTRDTNGIELLLSRGANASKANAEGNDPLMMAARHGSRGSRHSSAQGRRQCTGGQPIRHDRAHASGARSSRRDRSRALRAGADRNQADQQGLNATRYAHELGKPPPSLSRCSCQVTRRRPSTSGKCRGSTSPTSR